MKILELIFLLPESLSLEIITKKIYRQYFLQLLSVNIVHCNGSCNKYKPKSSNLEGGRYEQGQKRCPHCEVFIEWEGLWCPCCGRLLRTKPRARKLKQRLALSRTR